MAHSIPSDSLTLSAGWSFGDLWPFLLKKQVITKQNSILIFEASGNPVYSINFSDQFLGRKIKRRTGVDDCFSTYVVSPDQCSHLSAANDISIVHFKWNCSDQSPRRRYRSGRRSIRILIAINNRRQTPTPPPSPSSSSSLTVCLWREVRWRRRSLAFLFGCELPYLRECSNQWAATCFQKVCAMRNSWIFRLLEVMLKS